MRIIRILGFEYLAGRRVNRAVLGALAVGDFVLRPFLSTRHRAAPDPATVRAIALCKLDHMGDVLVATPTLQALRERMPAARRILIVGDWCRTVAEILRDGGLVDEVVICNAPTIDRTNRPFLVKWRLGFVSWLNAARTLRQRRVDVFLDLRPFSPNAAFLALASGAGYRAGFGLRGLGFTYHRLFPFRTNCAFGQLFLEAAASVCGGSFEYAGPALPAMRELAPARVEPGEPYLAVQLFSLEAARNVPPDLWMELLATLAVRYRLVLVGSAVDAGKVDARLLALPGVISCLGRTSIAELFRLVEESAGVVAVDSFVPHVGLAYGKRVAVLTVRGFSERRSYPSRNAKLGFFPSETTAADEVAGWFFAER